MLNKVGAHWPSHPQLVPCSNTLTSALFCLNVTPFESCPDTLATQGGPSLPFASFYVICVLAPWFVIDPSFTVRSQPYCDHQSQELKEVAMWTVLVTQKGSEIQGHCLLLAPRQTQTDGTYGMPWNSHGIPQLTGMPCVYISSDMQKILQGGGTCTPHPPDFTCYSRGDWD